MPVRYHRSGFFVLWKMICINNIGTLMSLCETTLLFYINLKRITQNFKK